MVCETLCLFQCYSVHWISIGKQRKADLAAESELFNSETTTGYGEFIIRSNDFCGRLNSIRRFIDSCCVSGGTTLKAKYCETRNSCWLE